MKTMTIVGIILLALLFTIQVSYGLFWGEAGSDGGIFLAGSGLCMLFIALPILLRRSPPDLFSPLVLSGLAFLIGAGLRAPYILFSSSSRADYVLFGMSLSEITNGLPVALLGSAAFAFGYALAPQARRTTVGGTDPFNPSYQRLALYAVLIGIVAWAGTVVFLQHAGINLSNGFAAATRKVSFAYQTQDGVVIQGSGGFLRFLAGLSDFPLFLVLYLWISGRLRLSGFWMILILFLSGPSLGLPFLLSSRTDMALFLINVAAFGSFYGKIKGRHIVLGAVTLIAMVTVMGNLRTENMGNTTAYGSSIDAIVGSGNGVDLVRIAGIANRVPDVVPYQLGKSYLAVLTFPIPRSIFPSKPNTALGPWVKEEIFGFSVPGNNGWPPTMIGEAYLNFGVLGVPVVMLLFGLLLGSVYARFRPRLGKRFVATAIYSVLLWRFGFNWIGLNFAIGAVQIITTIVPMVLLLHLIRRRVPSWQKCSNLYSYGVRNA
jgi:oligosaccharide repeat unit polymerase